MTQNRPSIRIKANKAKKFRCKDLIIVLENPKNLANIGSVLRNIDALGAEKLYIIDGNNLLPENWQEMRKRSKLIDISASAIKWVFVKKFKTFIDCASYLKKKGFVSYSTSPHQSDRWNINLQEGIYTIPKIAIWFGNESRGLSKEAMDYAHINIVIPMCGIIESLNLGTTTGIVIYEVAKQRRVFTK